jgi:ribose-phosphate pyrophosphokinase
MSDSPTPLLFSGSSHRPLAEEVAAYLGVEVGRAKLEFFPDQEIFVQILENVRRRRVFVLQSIARQPNIYLMELLIMIDALKRASAGSINVLIPYFGYGRQDRKDRGRVPITARLVANLLETAGATRVLTMDLHADQIQGFFNIPVDHLYSRPVMVAAVRRLGLDNPVVVSPDVGSIKLARRYAEVLKCDLAIVDKRRISSEKVEMTTVIGDVQDRDVLLVDDMCATGGTLVAAAQTCRDRGCRRVMAAVTHGLMVGNALQKLDESPIEKILISNTVPGAEELERGHPKIEAVSVASIFGEAINRVDSTQSISSLFK